MDISLGALAGLIAAVAFLILVLFLIPVLVRTAKTMKEVSRTVATTNKTVEQVTNNVDALSQQVEGLLVKSNTLLNDVNGKVQTLDPVFVAAADLGQSVSDINTSSKNIVHRVSGFSGTATKAGVAGTILKKSDAKEEKFRRS
ncbi:DUF948 domain-containing protein [Amylolactobacillus amylophilus]|uniref:DUF948 domain-containing protein n=1 Tax=Amylolactobacillus amylophilus TaxID=1603 RepID=UPI000B2D4B4D